MEVSKLFDNILDLPGIEGVCLFGTEGQMYINRLPSFLSNELVVDAQRRIVAMYETMDENFLPCDDYMLRFSERWVLLRRTEKQVLLVLGGEKANVASTRMVTNMTMKHLTPEIVSGLETAARGGLAAPAPVGGAASPSAASTVSPSQRFSTPPMPIPVASAASAPAPAASAPVGVADGAPPVDQTKPVRMYRGRAY
jgi:hypothetical protein